MKRVLKGVHVLMAVGLIVALAACSGSDGSLKRQLGDAQAAAMAAQMAADEAAAQAAADKMAADEAAAQAAADLMAAEEAAEQAAADLMAAEEAAAQAAAQAEADKMAAAEAAAQAAAQAEADKMAAAEAAAQAAAQAEADKKAAAEAAAQAAAQAEADKKAAADELAGVIANTIPELEAALDMAEVTLTKAQDDQAEADKALTKATTARKKAEDDLAKSDDPAGSNALIFALMDRITEEKKAEVTAMEAEKKATDAQEDVDTLDDALHAADTGPASEMLDKQTTAADIKAAQAAFKVLAKIESPTVITEPVTPAVFRKAFRSTLSVRYDREGPKFSAKGPTGSAATDPAWAKATTNMAPDIENWVSDTLTAKGTATGRPATGETATGMVYSNIAAPKYKAFAAAHGPNPELASTPASWGLAKIGPSNTYGRATTASTSYAVEGRYDGVDGTFSCTGTDCPTSLPLRKGDGTIIASTVPTIHPATGATWKFKPTDAAEMVAVEDTSYLLFGYWLSKSKDGPEEFAVWYGGGNTAKSAVAAEDDITALDEKVTYTGVAGGKYVTKDDVANTAEAGYFTATAVLTADFTAPLPDPNNAGTLEGTISDFKTGESDALGDLKLTLKKADLTYNTTDDTLNLVADVTVTNLVDATLSGGSHKAIGGWEAQLFGKEANTNIPTGVAGAFDAEIPDHAAVVGGFGAEKEK